MPFPFFPALSIEAARDALLQGDVILFPTETFFALGCDAMNPDAVGKVFSLKRRALEMPLPVVIGSRVQLSLLTRSIPKYAQSLMDVFWPGPLSIIFRAKPEIPDLLTANAHRVAVRFSPHPAVLRLCEATGSVLVASSANISGTPPTTRADDLAPSLVQGTAGLFLDGPAPFGGLPSTVVDIVEREGKPGLRVLRAGAVSVEQLRKKGFHLWTLPAGE